MACKACRARKIKCDRTRPVCQNCQQRSSHCTYAGERRTRRWTEAGMYSTDSLSAVHRRRPADIRSLIPINQPVLSPPRRPQMQSPGASPSCWRPMNLDPMEMEQDAMAGDIMSRESYELEPVLHTPTSSSASKQFDNLLDKILDGDDMECLKDRNPALWVRASDGEEYTGPSSGISTVSDLGLNWVRDNVAESDVLCETIQEIRNGILSHIRQPKCIPQDLPLALLTPSNARASTRDIAREIPPAQAMAYVEAYFSTVQVIFPILDRDVFLAQVAAAGAGQAPASTYSWQALYSAVLASGCRATLSEETAEAFKKSGREAWGYFQNALSFESRILHGATDLMAIQAVAVMTIFAQGLSSPQRLEYTLCSIASRLAQSLGLNSHPPSEWNLTENEKRERNRIFWVIYCLDKMISLRCGRPCVIYDEEVSSCFPCGVDVVQRGDNANSASGESPPFDFFLCFTKLSRIAGKVSRMLYSATALYTPSSRLILRLNGLLADLQIWVHSIPDIIRPGKPLNRMLDTQGMSRDQIVVLHTSYYYILCSIYRRFTPIFTPDSKSLEHLIDSKSHVSHIEAARSIALLTKHLDFESFSPAWLVFYYPFTALTTIFVHIVSNPPSESTQSDIALMETVVGFFGRLEYITSGETAFTKTAEFVRQARRVTDIQNESGGCASQRLRDPPASNPNTTTAFAPMQHYPDTRNGTVEVPHKANCDAVVAHDQLMNSSRNTGEGGRENLSQQVDTENSVGLGMGPASNMDYDIGVSRQGHALYADLVSLLAQPSTDDASNINNWLGDWVSVG
ncbi:fungal-specific transcription factor domain-containing protein [Penicillium frequentans]|uniref:Fungal-specific transcription factor domain-containing protein n=1 Tax=Penicillium frequentans TaxID=3151616 RepID=A0AAD6GBQ1_9EURO|nr:fungal-specific transcription factor domain-containing protein [Penicillium glabrum]